MAAQAPARRLCDVVALDHDLPGGRRDQPHDAARHGRLAGARFADDPERLAAPDRKLHVLRRLHHPAHPEHAAAAVGFAEPTRRERDRRVASRPSRARRHARHRRDQHFRVGMLGRAQHLPRLARLDDPPGLHHRDPIGDLGDHAEIMGDEQHAGAALALQVLDQPQDLRLGGDVEGRRRLVGDQQRGLQHQRHGDHDPLALAAGELMRIGVDQGRGLRQAHIAHDAEDALAPAPPDRDRYACAAPRRSGGRSSSPG